jgi:hypothetical protein
LARRVASLLVLQALSGLTACNALVGNEDITYADNLPVDGKRDNGSNPPPPPGPGSSSGGGPDATVETETDAEVDDGTLDGGDGGVVDGGFAADR